MDTDFTSLAIDPWSSIEYIQVISTSLHSTLCEIDTTQSTGFFTTHNPDTLSFFVCLFVKMKIKSFNLKLIRFKNQWWALISQVLFWFWSHIKRKISIVFSLLPPLLCLAYSLFLLIWWFWLFGWVFILFCFFSWVGGEGWRLLPFCCSVEFTQI